MLVLSLKLLEHCEIAHIGELPLFDTLWLNELSEHGRLSSNGSLKLSYKNKKKLSSCVLFGLKPSSWVIVI